MSRRERTCAEVREHLLARELGPATVEAVVEQLAEQGYLDDARYARLYVQDKRGLEQRGGERIRRELVSRGVDRELIELALFEEEPESELERALALLSRRFPEGAETRRDRERALAVLLRKGYDYELACEALAAHHPSETVGGDWRSG